MERVNAMVSDYELKLSTLREEMDAKLKLLSETLKEKENLAKTNENLGK